jgi:hypothetical protein
MNNPRYKVGRHVSWESKGIPGGDGIVREIRSGNDKGPWPYHAHAAHDGGFSW